MKEDEKMQLYCYEYEEFNKTIHDGLHEFCLCERVNEEHLRGSLIKNSKNINIAKEMKGKALILYIKSCLLGIFIG